LSRCESFHSVAVVQFDRVQFPTTDSRTKDSTVGKGLASGGQVNGPLTVDGNYTRLIRRLDEIEPVRKQVAAEVRSARR
jgi:hypothetical protein